ncbi:MAG: hypothetical protein KZQ96_20655 [Candidatus Thiodiazotropha sp. (ex Lucinoma borealis)]|nr:hypothetical protein [Candidatus Thiodiazotropha sp. (ex Lucinoma borealis)]
MNPDESVYYFLLGGYLLSHELTVHGHITEQTSQAILDEIIAYYVTSLEKDPTCQEAWIDLLEVHVILRQWDDAIACYGSSCTYITNPDFQLVRTFLGCLALVLAGDAIAPEDEQLLNDDDLMIAPDTYRFGEIEALIRDLKQEDYNQARLSQAIVIHDKFISHINQPLKNDY